MTATEVGSTLGPLIIESVDAAAMVDLSVLLGDPNPLHLDPAAVRAAGLGDRVINQGPSNFGYVLSMLRDTGMHVQEFRVRLLANVFGGDRVVAGGALDPSTEGGPDTGSDTTLKASRVTGRVWLDVDGGRRAIEGTVTLASSESPRAQRESVPGQPLRTIPAGHTVIEPAEQDQLERILESGRTGASKIGDVAHPAWVMICAMRGIGIGVGELFELLGCPMGDGPMLGEFSFESPVALRVGRRYDVTASVLDVVHKKGGKIGSFDLARTVFELTDEDGLACRVGMTFVLPRREPVPPLEPRTPAPEIQWAEAISLGDALLRSADRYGDQLALITPSSQQTYRELADRAEQIARGLIALGVDAGQRVGVLMANGFDCMASIFGVALAGATLVPINARFRTREMRYIIENADLAVILTAHANDDHVNFLSLLQESIELDLSDADPRNLRPGAAPELRTVVCFGPAPEAWVLPEHAFTALADTIAPGTLELRRATVGMRDHALILYTSGTTAQPRGALISHESIVRAWAGAGKRMRYTAVDRIWNPCPMFHIAAIGVTIATVLAGAVTVTAPFFDPDESLELLKAAAPTMLYPAYPAIALGILHHPRHAELDLSMATRILCVGPPETLQRIQRDLPQARLISTFGMTESCGCATLSGLDDPPDVRSATSGSALPGLQVRIADPITDLEYGPGTAGEIQLRGPLVFDGYHKDPERTSQVFTADGWMKTGDRGDLSAAGHVRYLGRIKDMIKVGGENVAPPEVEDHLMGHAAVHLAQIVGIPDERLGEVPVAFVQLLPGQQVTEAELIQFCVDQIARYKVPVAVRFVTEWPMSATKVKKGDLRAVIMAELGLLDS